MLQKCFLKRIVIKYFWENGKISYVLSCVVLCMWWQLISVADDQNNCYHHTCTHFTNKRFQLLNIYNKCVSAWQQLQTYRETYILMLIWTWQLVMCVCVYVHKFKRHAWKKRVQRTLGQRTLDIWQRMFYVVYLHW